MRESAKIIWDDSLANLNERWDFAFDELTERLTQEVSDILNGQWLFKSPPRHGGGESTENKMNYTRRNVASGGNYTERDELVQGVVRVLFSSNYELLT